MRPQVYQPGAEQIVIIGGGPAGMAAAMDLPGALLIEAKTHLGGRAGGSAQVLFFVGSREQAAMGIVDSSAQAMEDWQPLTGGAPTQAAQDYLMALPQVRERLWDLGLSFRLNPPDPWTGSQRLHGAEEPGLPATLEAALPLDVEVLLSTWVEGLVIEGGQVLGVETADGFIPAHTVIVASGGFANHIEQVGRYTGWRPGTWTIGGDSFAWGDAVDWAERYDLGLSNMEAMGAFANALPAQGEEALAVELDLQGPTPYIWVNQDAQRFVDEGQDYSLYIAGALSEQETVWGLITYQALLPLLPEGQIDALEGVVCAPRWAELAERIELDPVALEQTLSELGPAASRFRIDGQPCAFAPGYTSQKGFGGVAVDDQQRVLDLDGQVVSGLYAVGEAAGMAVPGLGGDYGFDGSLSAVVWSGWRAAEAINQR